MFRALIAGLLLVAAAQSPAATLGANGRGQVLLFPFVIAENGWDTLIGLNLDPTGGHVVRLRFMDPRDGRPLHTFNIYSRYGENWRAAITGVEDGWALRIAEGSCTVSDAGEFGGPGAEFRLDTGVGMLEAYSITQVFADYTATPFDAPPVNSCADLAARHGPGGIWVQTPKIGMADSPVASGEMAGYFDLVNVAQGLSATLPATAIRNFKESLFHTTPSSESPHLGDALPIAVLEDGTVIEPASGEGIDALAMLLSPLGRVLGTQDRSSGGAFGASLFNDIITTRGIAASTDWIVTFPLRGYAPDLEPNAMVNGEPRLCESTGEFLEEPPYIDSRLGAYGWFYWGEGKGYGGFGGVLDPPPPVRVGAIVCNAVNSLAFGKAPGIFLADTSEFQYRKTHLGNAPVDDVSMRLGYKTSNGWRTKDGFFLPLLGFRVSTFVNGAVERFPGVDPPAYALANYMTIRPHELR